MKPSRQWSSGSSRCCFATWIVAASSRCSESESVTPASESRSAATAARSSGGWAGSRVDGGRDRASRPTSRRRMDQLYPAAEGTFTRATPSAVPEIFSRSEIRREGEVDLRASRRAGRGIGERRCDADPELHREVIVDGEIAGELDARGAESREPRRLPGAPRVAHVAERVEPQLVGPEGKMAQWRSDQRKREAILECGGGGPGAPTIAPPAGADGEIHRSTETPGAPYDHASPTQSTRPEALTPHCPHRCRCH